MKPPSTHPGPPACHPAARSVRTPRPGLTAGLLFALTAATMAWPRPGLAADPKPAKLTQALTARSYKVRLQAAILIGKHKVLPALPALRHVASAPAEHPAVLAASLVALAQLGDQDSRARLAFLVAHNNELIAKAAAKALMMLDQALPAKPFYLVAIEKPRLPAAVPADRSELVFEILRRRVAATGGLVLGAGEARFLDDGQLAAHLAARELAGLLVRPELLALRAEVAGGRTTVVAQLRLTQFSLPGKRQEFAGEGGADAWIEDTRINAVERQELEAEVIEGAAASALAQLLQDLQNRAE